MKSKTYLMAREFKNKYPRTIAWRIHEHCKIIDKHLNPDEKVLYVFAGQKNHKSYDFLNTNVVALTNKRLMIATKRLLFGYFFISITPDMFNDLTVINGIIWGKIKIDTIKEIVFISNIDPNALPEIATNITEDTMAEQKKYINNNHENK